MYTVQVSGSVVKLPDLLDFVASHHPMLSSQQTRTAKSLRENLSAAHWDFCCLAACLVSSNAAHVFDPQSVSDAVAYAEDVFRRHKPSKFRQLERVARVWAHPAAVDLPKKWTSPVVFDNTGTATATNGINTFNVVTGNEYINSTCISSTVLIPNIYLSDAAGVFLSTSNSPSLVSTPSLGLRDYATRMLRKRVSKNTRRVIRRQLDLLGAVVPKKDVHCFLSGGSIVVVSEYTGIKYRFTAKTVDAVGLVKAGHGAPYKLEVLDEDDTYICSLCVYLRDTPMLDQMAAMVMYIRAGEEEALLRAANPFAVGDARRLQKVYAGLGRNLPSYERNGVYLNPPSKMLSQQPAVATPPGFYRLKDVADDYHVLKLMEKTRF